MDYWYQYYCPSVCPRWAQPLVLFRIWKCCVEWNSPWLAYVLGLSCSWNSNSSCIHFCFCPCLCFTMCYMSILLAMFFGDHLIFINFMVCVSCRHCPQLKSKLESWKKKLPPLMQLARFVDTHIDYIKNHVLLLEILTYLDKCLNMAIQIQLCACRRLWGNIMH